MPSVVEVDTRVLDRILKNLPGNARDNVRAIAFAIERKAKEKAPVDTGALRASIYTRVGRHEGSLPMVARQDAGRAELPQPENELTAIVGPSMEYAPYVEYGTHRQSGQPYLTPAVRETESMLEQGWGHVVTDD